MSAELRETLRSEVEVLDRDEENDPNELINAFDRELEQLQMDMEFKARMGEAVAGSAVEGTEGDEDDQL